ncbi:lamin tail domain-containing protein [uncultured Microbacterium sp.]|uniref:lamin tail domain-containing protein n=1 Tax=Microbacterium algeriense TaxID=2615184 RepID=UPI0025956CDB|nr:lamin tail domain-containing protein [uncultured Microbacterium sp.]
MPRLHSAAAVAAVCALSAAALLAAPVAAIGADPGIRPAEAPAAAPGLVLNEIVYDDAATGLADQIELYNAGSETVDLTGWTVADEKRDSFGKAPEGTSLAPGEFLVLVKDVDFPFGLGKGDEVVLIDPSSTEVDSYAYENTAPLSVWARCPDGTGAWAHATTATPGAPNDCSVAPVAGSILINEVDSQPADWVEFHNPGTEALDISGYEIRDNSDDHRWRFRPGTQIGAGEFLVVEESTIGLVDGVETAFRDPIGIGSADRIRLFDATGTALDDTLPWQGHAAIDGDFAAATLARCPDGIGAFVLAYATPGAANSCVLPDVVINEIESNGDATDWVEVTNTGSTAVDLSGWTVMDSDPTGHAAETTPLPAGTILQPGGYFVFDQPRDFVFGLGNGDTVTIRDANGNTVDEHVYTAHAAGVLARCADGTGAFVDIAVSTKGQRNACGNPVRINEVESDGGSPDDWVELVNPTDATLDVSGVVVKDDDDAHAYAVPAGTSIGAGGYLVIERAQLGFGLGAGDAVRLFDGDLLIDETTWGDGHAATTWGRCPDTTGAFAATAESTKGAANVCDGEVEVGVWPGSADVRVLDSVPTFLEDSSGLDVQETADGAFLWAVDNGEGRIWKLEAHADGSVEKVDGWNAGKRVRFQKDAADPGAAGPDTEGITVDGDGFVYVASERDNSAKGVNQNVVLKVDPEASAGDLVAQQEWDLTAQLPAVGANLGIEAVQWVPDAALAGKLFDDTTSAPYDPARYAGHGDGLFLVAVEDNGHVYAFALGGDGSATLVSEITPGLAGVMALDYDSVRGTLWAVCDDGCHGRSAEVTLNGTAQPGIAHYARPAGMPDINNEGFATAPASLSVDGQRPVWWFADGFASESLRTGTLPGATGENPGGENPGGENPGGENPGGENPGGENPPLPGTGLVDGNRHGVTVDPAVAAPGQRVTVTVGAEASGAEASVWMYSDPVRIGGGTLSAAGAITVTIPADAALGAHRIAVYAADGALLGWADIRIAAGSATGLAATGADLPIGAVALALTLLAAGTLAVTRRRRTAA